MDTVGPRLYTCLFEGRGPPQIDADAQRNESPLTLAGAGHQWPVRTSIGCNQWLSLATPPLKVALGGRIRSLVVRTNKCGWAIRELGFSCFFSKLTFKHRFLAKHPHNQEAIPFLCISMYLAKNRVGGWDIPSFQIYAE